MTDQQAVAEAMRRWGAEGRAWHPRYDVRDGLCYCLVGETNGRLHDHQWIVRGMGVTWEEAFAEVDARGG